MTTRFYPHPSPRFYEVEVEEDGRFSVDIALPVHSDGMLHCLVVLRAAPGSALSFVPVVMGRSQGILEHDVLSQVHPPVTMDVGDVPGFQAAKITVAVGDDIKTVILDVPKPRDYFTGLEKDVGHDGIVMFDALSPGSYRIWRVPREFDFGKLESLKLSPVHVSEGASLFIDLR